MPLYKLVLKSERTDRKQEIFCWNSIGSLTWERLIEKLNSIYNVSEGNYLVTWFDGQDHCTLHDTNELQDAETQLRHSSNPENTLWLNITLLQENTAGEKPNSDSVQKGLACDVPVNRQTQQQSGVSRPGVQQKTKHHVVRTTYPTNCAQATTSNAAPQNGLHQTQPAEHWNGTQSCFSLDNDPLSFCIPRPQLESDLAHEYNRNRSRPNPFNVNLTPRKLSPSATTLLSLANRSKNQPQYVKSRLEALRAMGFEQDDLALTTMIRECYGDLNRVIERLTCF
ncbi:hypothetical protein CSKR_200651 [Clonorchis sinensis]|uniref:UBA domain-containing protein n=1 Tax=Clonorchis sinensis TaxID=79923 RepID=A0A8T1MFT7_CLOSI|nr:hypothetical protein CSKR_200651 [Clonorchis sinensis]